MSKALEMYQKSTEALKTIETLVYEEICRKIEKQTRLGGTHICIRMSKYNLSGNNESHILTRLQQDGFYVMQTSLYTLEYCFYWDEPVGYEYIVGGAKYNESKKALENSDQTV